MKKLTFLFLVTITVLFGCTRRMVDFTIISTKNVDFSKGQTFKRGSGRVDGLDMAHFIVFIPTGFPNIKEAIDKAIESVPGCVALLDGVVYHKFWHIYLYGKQSFLVTGTPLIDPSLTHNPEVIPTYALIDVDKEGDIRVKSISKADYQFYLDKTVRDSHKDYFMNYGTTK